MRNKILKIYRQIYYVYKVCRKYNYSRIDSCVGVYKSFFGKNLTPEEVFGKQDK